jgi:hypothetical protein
MTTAEFLQGPAKTQQPATEVVVQDPHSGHAPLFQEVELNDLRERWKRIQGDFVDDPRAVVKQADELVAATMKRLAEIFSEERSKLEQEWSRGEQVSTVDLRQALRRYRSFFDRLLTV